MTDGRERFLHLEGVRKTYGSSVAVQSVSLDVEEGEFISFLGPSGSGKTTTLQMIAGFIDPDQGTVTLAGNDLTAVSTHKRDIGMVFQNYALFPHLTVAQNVAFPLKMRKVPATEIKTRVARALDQVHLSALADRKPAALSGGQQQRVALARAFVFEPKLLLMDEPLGALDKKLREVLQLEIVRITRELGITVVYVTHDQEEALAMSDRIAIYNNGLIEQLGTGEELYERPASLFVATFMGDSNVFRGVLENDGVEEGIRTPAGVISARRRNPDVDLAGIGATASVVVRPEKIDIGESNHARAVVVAVVTEVVYLGSGQRILADVEGLGSVMIKRPIESAGYPVLPGARVGLIWAPEDAMLLADTTAATLTGLIKVP